MLRTLANTRASEAAVCGHKAARLGELAARGYRVPPALVLSAARLGDCLPADLPGQLAARAIETATASVERLLAIEQEAVALFEQAALPADVAADLQAWLGASAAARFAVRSSATTEDLPNASCAGLYRSFVDVTAGEVPRLVLRCCASLFGAGAALYRRRRKIANVARMAVLVQEFVAADHAGVVFTRAPGRPDQLLLECAPGPAAPIVSGTIAPNRYYLNRATVQIEETHGGWPLDVAQVRMAAREALAIDADLGRAQDIEYCVRDDAVFILQARPAWTEPARGDDRAAR